MSESVMACHGLATVLKSLPAGEAGAGLHVEIVSGLSFLNLRGNPREAPFVTAAECALGQKLPPRANTFSQGSCRVFWLGPDEWLIAGPTEMVDGVRCALSLDLSSLHGCVTDVSGAQVCLRLRGASVRELLAKGCTLDLHARVFKNGDCAQSGLAKTNVLIALIDDQPVFEIFVRRSFAEYLLLWLAQAGNEYAIGFTG